MKKAFMKTLEMLFVVVLSSIFLLAIVPQAANAPVTGRISYLVKLEKDENFRSFVNSNPGCFNSTNTLVDSLMQRYAQKKFDYVLCSGERASNLPSKTVYLDTLFFAGNITDTNYRIIRLYYWHMG